MPLLRTKENFVVAYEADEDDVFVQVVWQGPSELHGGRYAKTFFGPLMDIADYQKAVDWAVGMADYMRFPLHVLPRRASDLPRRNEI